MRLSFGIFCQRGFGPLLGPEQPYVGLLDTTRSGLLRSLLSDLWLLAHAMFI